MSSYGGSHDPVSAAFGVQPDFDPVALTGDYTIDPAHTSIGFVARHAMVTNVTGSFLEFEGTLHLDGRNPAASSACLSVTMDSVSTGANQRDVHLRSADFFDTDTYPRMTFRSTHAQTMGDGYYQLTGDLSILGITRSINIDLEFNGHARDPFGNERVGFEGSSALRRSEWGLTWNAALETGGVLISDQIKLVFDISAIKNTV